VPDGPQPTEARPMLDVECPQCANKMQAPNDFAGKRAKCVKCGHAFAVNAPVVDFVPVFRQAIPQPRRAFTRISRHRLIAPLAAAAGGLIFCTGLVGICLALSMDPTVEATPLEAGNRQTERIYNPGRMHQREIALIGSATATLAGMVAIGFSAVCLRIGGPFASSDASQ
jgi:hypothetical protein